MLPQGNTGRNTSTFGDNMETPVESVIDVVNHDSTINSTVVNMLDESAFSNENPPARVTDESVVIHTQNVEPSLPDANRFHAIQNRLRQALGYVSTDNTTNENDETDTSNQSLAWHFLVQPPLVFSLVMMTVVALFLIVVKEMSNHTNLLVSTVVAILHYQDSTKFNRIVEENLGHKVWTVFFGLILRNAVNFIFWWQFEVYRMAALIPMSSGKESFFITITHIVQAEVVAMDVALVLKLIVFCFPWSSGGLKRRVYIWFDHTFYIYRMIIPVPQWLVYFETPFLIVIYLLVKIYTFLTRIFVYLKFTKTVVSNINLGTPVLSSEIDPDSFCSICQCAFKDPRKLQCTHVFCADCIRTWMDTGKGDTCPLCRTHVLNSNSSKVNDYESCFPVNLF